MIDCHAHILPGLDDGAPSLEAAVKLARQAWEDGVETVVCTPHASSSTLQEQLTRRNQGLAALQEQLRKEGIGLKLLPGMEYRADGHAVDCALRTPECRLGGGADGPILVELPFSVDIAFAGDLFFQAQCRGVTLILAHPERYAGFSKQKENLLNWMERGLYLQFNAAALEPGFSWFRPVYRCMLALMEKYPEQVLLGSDAHDAETRPCRLSSAEKSVKGRFGEAVWKKISGENARRLLRME